MKNLESKVIELKKRISKIDAPCEELEIIRTETEKLWVPLTIEERRPIVQHFMFITDRYATITVEHERAERKKKFFNP